MRGLLKHLDRIVTLMAIAGGLVVAGLVVLTFVDVIMRYFFSAPMRGRQDIVEMGMVTALLLAAPYTWRISGHISVDLFRHLPIKLLERLRWLFVKLLVAGVFALIAWRAWYAAEDAALFNEATNMITIPHRPFIFLIMVVAIIHAAIILLECLAGPEDPQDDGGGS